jgi:hypothetical protein
MTAKVLHIFFRSKKVTITFLSFQYEEMHTTDNIAYRNKILAFDGLRGDGNKPENCGYVRPTIKRILPENTGDWAKMWFKVPRYILRADDESSCYGVSCLGIQLLGGNGKFAWLFILFLIFGVLFLIK